MAYISQVYMSWPSEKELKIDTYVYLYWWSLDIQAQKRHIGCGIRALVQNCVLKKNCSWHESALWCKGSFFFTSEGPVVYWFVCLFDGV